MEVAVFASKDKISIQAQPLNGACQGYTAELRLAKESVGSLLELGQVLSNLQFLLLIVFVNNTEQQKHVRIQKKKKKGKTIAKLKDTLGRIGFSSPPPYLCLKGLSCEEVILSGL